MKYLLTGQETDRLYFRPVSMDDFERWLPFFIQKEIYKFLWLDPNKTEEELCLYWFEKCLARYDEDRGGLNALIDKNSGALIGKCGLLVQNIDGEKRLEVGYSMLPQYRGRGYATEAAIFTKNYGFLNQFDLEFDSNIISMVHVENQNSAKVARNNGMSLEKQVSGLDDNIFDIFSISRATWESSEAAPTP